jgi:hypothetical protein
MEIIDPDGMLTEGRLASGEQTPAEARLAAQPETAAKIDAFLADPSAGIEMERPPRRTPRVTWEDIEAVYPDIAPAELRAELKAYGYEEHQLDALVFEVVTEGSWARWSNERQRFEQMSEPDFWPFSQGGILVIMAGSTREPFGPGRKTSKWFVATEVFQTYAEALARSEEVKAAPPKGNGDPADYAHLWERR